MIENSIRLGVIISKELETTATPDENYKLRLYSNARSTVDIGNAKDSAKTLMGNDVPLKKEEFLDKLKDQNSIFKDLGDDNKINTIFKSYF